MRRALQAAVRAGRGRTGRESVRPAQHHPPPDISLLDRDFLSYDPASRTLAVSYTRFFPYVYEHAARIPAGSNAVAIGGPAHPVVVSAGQPHGSPDHLGVKSLDGSVIAGYSRGIGQDFPRLAFDAAAHAVVFVSPSLSSTTAEETLRPPGPARAGAAAGVAFGWLRIAPATGRLARRSRSDVREDTKLMIILPAAWRISWASCSHPDA
jgi:hypothetical protein